MWAPNRPDCAVHDLGLEGGLCNCEEPRVKDVSAGDPDAVEAILHIRQVLLDQMKLMGQPDGHAVKTSKAYRWLKSMTDEIVEEGW